VSVCLSVCLTTRPVGLTVVCGPLQAEDRAHRLGQQGCVQVRYLIAPGTVDDAMWPLLGRKLQVVGKALDGHATGTATGKSLSNKKLTKIKTKTQFLFHLSKRFTS